MGRSSTTRRALLTVALSVGVVGAGFSPAAGATDASARSDAERLIPESPNGNGIRAVPLSLSVLDAVRAASLADVVDFGPAADLCPGDPSCPTVAAPIAATPNVDVAVIALGPDDKVLDATNVLLSRDYPDGISVPLAPDLSAASVRFRRWDIDRWNGFTDNGDGTTSPVGWLSEPDFLPDDDLVTGRDGAPLQFMSPYPGGLAGLPLAFAVARFADAGMLDLDTVITDATGASAPVRRWVDRMLTQSSSAAAFAVVAHLHALGLVDAMNADFARLGLGTIQILGTDPVTGGAWAPGRISMTAMDTARLLLLIDGPGSNRAVWWTATDGSPVGRQVLSAERRDWLNSMLNQQGFNETLSTTNLCGASYASVGIPQRVSSRWMGDDGTVTVGGIPFAHDVRPCNRAAEVSFGHKTGLSWNYASDAGIVRSLPGVPERHYIVVVMSNLGYRFADPAYASATTNPCFDPGVCVSQRIPALGAAIDAAVRTRTLGR